MPMIRRPIEIPKKKPTILSTKKTPKKFGIFEINFERIIENKYNEIINKMIQETIFFTELEIRSKSINKLI